MSKAPPPLRKMSTSAGLTCKLNQFLRKFPTPTWSHLSSSLHNQGKLRKKDVCCSFGRRRADLAQCIQDPGSQHESKDDFVPLKQASLDVGVDLVREMVNDAGNSFGRDCRLLTAINCTLIQVAELQGKKKYSEGYFWVAGFHLPIGFSRSLWRLFWP